MMTTKRSNPALSPAVMALLVLPAASATLAAYTGMKMMATSAEMDDLIVAAQENTDLDDSVVTFLGGLAGQLEQVAGDKAATVKLAATLREKSAAVSAALAANTPAAP